MKIVIVCLSLSLCASAYSADAAADVDWCAFARKAAKASTSDFDAWKGGPVPGTPTRPAPANTFVGLEKPAPDLACEAHEVIFDDAAEKSPRAGYSCYVFNSGDSGGWCAADACRDATYEDAAAAYADIKKRLKACFPSAESTEKTSGSETTRDVDRDFTALLPKTALLIKFYDSGKGEDETAAMLGTTPKGGHKVTLYLTIWNRKPRRIAASRP